MTSDLTPYVNAAAIAAVAYEEARNHLRTACTTALDNGVTLTELAQATGRTEGFILGLIREGTL